MAQLPLKFSSTFYISYATSPMAVHNSPPPSSHSGYSSQASIDKKMIRSILRFFRSPKRKRGPSSTSSKSSKLIACFSQGKHPPPAASDGSLLVLDADGQDQTKWDSSSPSSDSTGGLETQASEADSKETTRDSRDSASDELLVVLSNGSEREAVSDEEINNNAMKIVTVSDSVIGAGNPEEPKLDVPVSSAGISKSLCTSMEIVRLSSVKRGEGSLTVNNAHGLALFIAKLLKAMNNYSGCQTPMILSKDGKRKGEIMLMSGNSRLKGKEKSRGSRNRHQIWTKPIMMGRRCRKLEDGFPYGDDDEVVAAESMAGEHYPRVLV